MNPNLSVSLSSTAARRCGLILVAAFAVSVSSSAFAVGVKLGAPGLPAGEVHPGELLLGELNCVACHNAEASTRDRLRSRLAPKLVDAGSRITPQYLRAFLTNPHAQKEGTPMPNLLAGRDAAEQQDMVDSLVHFLSSLTSTNVLTAVSPYASLIDQGKALYHSVGCVACHAPQIAPEGGSLDAIAGLAESSVPLGDLAKKSTVEQLAAFLQDPLRVRPSGRMPSLNLSIGEARAIAAYLVRAQATAGEQGPEVRIPGLHFDYFEKSFKNVGDMDNAVPVSSGVVERVNLSPKKRNEQFGLRFTGFIKAPRDSTYTFNLTSDDGAKLWIDGKVVVENDGIHPPSEKIGKIELKAGDHSFALSYFNEGAGGELAVGWADESGARRGIPANALSHSGRTYKPLGSEAFALDTAKVSRGREWFGSLGCASCHDAGTGLAQSSTLSAPPLDRLSGRVEAGCLGPAKKGVPQFDLSPAQREALQAVLRDPAKLAQPLSPAATVSRTMASLNCYACHSRESVGGPSAARAEYFSTVDHADLGDEGRIPPHLNQVGGKLKEAWIKAVLTSKGSVRPYMATRMPQFGPEAVGHLPALFEAVDGGGRGAGVDVPNPQETKFGRQLVGTGGLSCIACHVFAGQKSLGIPAIDLTLMAHRLKRDWFVRYLKDPASLRPGTRMPSFWPEGKAANQDILGGSTEKQISAIWSYLSAGGAAKPPEGLTKVGIELVADKEAVIYRHFIEGAGSRAIGVGYPEKANLAFDANQLRLALIWHGKFIDAGRHRNDRGTGYEGPLGDDVMKMPEGAPFASLADSQAPWPKETGAAAGYQMKGYRLDEQQRPTFLYEFHGIRVEDAPIPQKREPEPILQRSLSLTSEESIPSMWFRAAVGGSIEKVDGGYRIDGRLLLKVDSGGSGDPVVRPSGGQMELLVPVGGHGKQSKIVEEIVW